MTWYGDMARNAQTGAECLERDMNQRDRREVQTGEAEHRVMRVRPSASGMCWMGRVFIEGTGYIWVPLPFTTLADWETVRTAMAEKGYSTILDQ